jgi:hypothetical protein
MADGVLSMFMTPEQYQLMQNTAQQQRALQFAQLDPMAQGQYGLFLGGSQLGTAIGRGLGGEDRQLKLISQRQALSQNIDPSNPESILKVAQEASRLGDQQFALSLADYARQASSEIALAKQRLEERRNAIAPDIQIAQYKARLSNGIAALKDATDPESIAQREALQRELDGLPTKAGDTTNEIKNATESAIRAGFKPGTPEFDTAVSERLDKLLTKPEKDLTFGVDREAKSYEKYSKPFRDLTQDEKAIVNRLLDEEGRGRAREGAAKLVMPGTDKLAGIPQFRRDVQATVEPERKVVTAADQAIAAVRESISTGNPASWNAAKTSFARAVSGSGDLNKQELQAAGIDPNVFVSAADYISSKLTSTPTKETQQQLEKAITSIRAVAAKKARNEIERQRKIGEKVGYPADVLRETLDFSEFNEPTGAGGKKTTSWNDLPAQQPKQK